ncbi:MAG: ribosomal protein [Gammaproteobacteria bacterium]|jgi:large subunit ribosomal protein L18|nr:ribosomal protein [Gammaproteobacteria bacterium]
MDNRTARLRRTKKTRSIIRELGATRLCISRSSQHIYAQIISPTGGTVIASASTLEKKFRESFPNGGNIEAAKEVGQLIAQRALEKGVRKVAFDRSGFKYHGRIKALAEAARDAGLDF